ncbi:MAG TPA: LytR C-terminal domain-containing protein [Nakamurella sp.]|nr:LytR C-terminal domain-containing protein [Nakamurella sp.]
MSPDPASPRYRRRRRWPMLLVMVALLAGVIVVWAQVLKPAPAEEAGCNEPGPAPTSRAVTRSTSSTTNTSSTSTGTGTSTGTRTSGTGSTSTATTSTTASSRITTTLGTFTDPNTLAATRPADPSQVPLRVLNASDVTGQAKTVTDELRSAGFASILQQANDPLYPAWDLRCYGEIRYGLAGLAEARTVLIVAPCAQLVQDDRADNSVDLALGKRYEVEPISDAIRDQLTKIKNASAPPPVIEGQTVSIRPLPSIPPLPDRSGCPA